MIMMKKKKENYISKQFGKNTTFNFENSSFGHVCVNSIENTCIRL